MLPFDPVSLKSVDAGEDIRTSSPSAPAVFKVSHQEGVCLCTVESA